MIPVTPAPEPADFDQRVRQPGLGAIAELVGEPPPRPRPGPKRSSVATVREKIPPANFPPFWRAVLPDMLTAYNRVCAYLGLYIEHVTGNSSVDHMAAKSGAWDQVYEWTNYRLAAARINARKSNLQLLLDPFTISDGLFALEFVEFQVVPGPGAGGMTQQVVDTIDALGLNAQECRDARREYVECYDTGDIKHAYLERRAPFVAREMRRQQRLRPEDA